jgi:DNA modification methylase
MLTTRKEILAEGVTLHLGDCREILPTLSKVAAVITDPPYSSGARTDSERQVRGAMLRSMEDPGSAMTP